MNRVVGDTRVTLILQVKTRNEWGNLRVRRMHPEEVQTELVYFRQQLDRWENCRFFGDAPLRIRWREPSGTEFTV